MFNAADPASFKHALPLSPLRNSSQAHDIAGLVTEQLRHFGIDPESDYGRTLAEVTKPIYTCKMGIDALWIYTQEHMQHLSQAEGIARFNANKFLAFQLAKVLDGLQQEFRQSYQQLSFSQSTLTAKSSYPIFDNVTALFSATPVIARTATYIYACAEWIADAFEGKELLLEIYSRLLNPTSVSLANHIVDLEAGAYAADYLAWNFNSGMAAIDCTLAHLLGYQDILIVNRNIYGGAHQLIYDWYAKASNLDIAVVTFSGEDSSAFAAALQQARQQYGERLAQGRQIYVYLESPCNPHGYVLDVPGICRLAHEQGLRVMLDSTVATPFLYRPLQRSDSAERPDFVIHSYTKDLSGTGSVIAGGVIGRNSDMFIPKGEPGWDSTLFWNVYYVKGAFLSADAAFEVMQGMRTLEMRMLKKCINTRILAEFLATHPQIQVNCSALNANTNRSLAQQQLFLGLPAPLFTTAMPDLERHVFQRFFDALEPSFGHMVSLGQTNSIVSCPGLTTHSELSPEQQLDANIYPTTIRFAVGDENPRDLLRHLRHASALAIDPVMPGFSSQFPDELASRDLIRRVYLDTHAAYIESSL